MKSSLAPMTLVLASGIDLSKVESVVIFPPYASDVVREIMHVRERGLQVSIVALGISYIFSVSFIKHLSRAFTYVSEGALGPRREAFYWFFMPIFVVASLTLLFMSIVLSLYLKVIMLRPLSFVVESL